MASPTHDHSQTLIAAPAERIYDLVADLSRMGEWSPECRRCEWIGGATGPQVGARFHGHNRYGPVRWSLKGDVKVADRGREFSFATIDRGREGTQWTYTFEPVGTMTRVTESYDVRYEPLYARVMDLFAPRRRRLRVGMEQTLARIKAVAEATPRQADASPPRRTARGSAPKSRPWDRGRQRLTP